MAVEGARWGVYTVTVDATVATPQMTVSFVDLLTGATLFSDVVDNGTTGAVTLGFSNDGVLFGGEQGGAAGDTNGWGGAVADVVVYDSLLTSSDITANISEFQSLYAVPEPSAFAFLGLTAGFGLLRRKRK